MIYAITVMFDTGRQIIPRFPMRKSHFPLKIADSKQLAASTTKKVYETCYMQSIISICVHCVLCSTISLHMYTSVTFAKLRKKKLIRFPFLSFAYVELTELSLVSIALALSSSFDIVLE